MSPNSTSTTHTSSNHRSQPTAQACAACKYQRRKCKPDCILAPFFPADHLQQFLNAHRLFGVKKILKIVTGLDPVLRVRAMDSIIFESNARAQDPVGGCLRIINQLHYQLQRDAADLSIVLGQLAFYREQAQQVTQAQDNQQFIPAIQPNVSINPIFNMGGGVDIYAPAAAAINQQEFIVDHTLQQQQQQQQQYCHDYFYFNGEDNNNASSNSNSNSNSNSINNYNTNGNVVEMDVPLSMLCLQQQEGEEEDAKSLADVFAVREEFGQDEAGAAASLHCRLGLGFQSSSEFT